ncbi:hypothetical protein DL765_006948 [Monosporascus sp. GIB2]|nr:hypothetical protein DL765_006948 [Monosporascus sp. GIB2]
MEAVVFKALVEVKPAPSELPAARLRPTASTQQFYASQHLNSHPPPGQAGRLRDERTGGTPAKPADAFEALPIFYDPPMNNVLGGAVSLVVVGLRLGPVYPCAPAIFARNPARARQASDLGVANAVAPFATDVLAQAAGTFVLHPIPTGLFSVMVLTWYGQPSVRKTAE